MKRKFVILFSSILGLAFISGTAGGVVAFLNNNEEKNSPTKLIIPSQQELQLIPHSGWKSDNATFAAYFYGESGNEWVKMSDEDNNGVYEVVSPGEWEKVIFCRMKPDSEQLSWDNRWNQTVNLTFDGVNTCFDIQDPWDEKKENEGNATGTWRSLITTDTLVENLKPYESSRVWLTLSSEVSSWWMSSNERTYVRYWDKDGSSYYTKISEITSGERQYYYTNISTSSVGYQIVRCHKDYKCIYNYTENIEIDENYIAGKIVKIISEKSEGETGNNKYEYMVPETVTVEMSLLALEGIVSCSTGRLNGVGAYNTMKSTFFDIMSEGDYETFLNSEILDYEGNDIFEGYNEDMVQETTYLVRDKIQFIEGYQSGSKTAINLIKQDQYLYILIPIISLILILGFTYFLKKRKFNR